MDGYKFGKAIDFISMENVLITRTEDGGTVGQHKQTQLYRAWDTQYTCILISDYSWVRYQLSACRFLTTRVILLYEITAANICMLK